METIAQRVAARRQELGLSQTELAKRAGCSQGTIGNIESGTRTQPRNLLALAAALEVFPEWLETGEGEKVIPRLEFRPVPVRRVDQRLSAGSGHPVYLDDQERWLAFQPSFLSKMGISARHAAIFDVSGHSMEPELRDGSVVLINMNVRYDTVIDGKHYAFIHDDECKVKTLYKMADGSIKAVSQNPDKSLPEHQDFYIQNGDKFEPLGMVVWEGRVV